MILGGGALDAMNKTLKANRDLLKNNKSKPFDKNGYTGKEEPEAILKDKAPMPENERARFLQKLDDDRRRAFYVRLFIMLSLGIPGIALMVVFIF